MIRQLCYAQGRINVHSSLSSLAASLLPRPSESTVEFGIAPGRSRMQNRSVEVVTISRFSTLFRGSRRRKYDEMTFHQLREIDLSGTQFLSNSNGAISDIFIFRHICNGPYNDMF